MATYQAPTITIGRGRKRHEAKIPTPKAICQRPGAIHRHCGANTVSTAVSIAAAIAAGTNCMTAAAIISSARCECRRRVRSFISKPITPAETAATAIQSARKVCRWAGAIGSQSPWAIAASTASTAVAAKADGPRPWNCLALGQLALDGADLGQGPIQVLHALRPKAPAARRSRALHCKVSRSPGRAQPPPSIDSARVLRTRP